MQEKRGTGVWNALDAKHEPHTMCQRMRRGGVWHALDANPRTPHQVQEEEEEEDSDDGQETRDAIGKAMEEARKAAEALNW